MAVKLSSNLKPICLFVTFVLGHAFSQLNALNHALIQGPRMSCSDSITG